MQILTKPPLDMDIPVFLLLLASSRLLMYLRTSRP